MNTTILLLSVDEAPMLERSLPAAVSQTPAAEVVVVDNACTDATAELAERHGARRLALEPRRTYAAAINAAIAGTGGDAVLLLNADCFLRPGFLAAALSRLAEDGVGSVAPKLLRAARPRRAARPSRGPRSMPPGCSSTAGARTGSSDTAGRRAASAARARRSAPTARRRCTGGETLEECALGGGEVLDEDMALWASDVDLAWRAQLRGWRSVYEPAAVAEHVRTYSPSTRAQMSEEARRLQFRNRYLMMIKNETAAGLRRDAGVDRRLRGCWPSATCCCASAICSAATGTRGACGPELGAGDGWFRTGGAPCRPFGLRPRE